MKEDVYQKAEHEVKDMFASLIVKVPEVVAIDTLKRLHDWFENPGASFNDGYVRNQVCYLQRVLDKPLV